MSEPAIDHMKREFNGLPTGDIRSGIMKATSSHREVVLGKELQTDGKDPEETVKEPDPGLVKDIIHKMQDEERPTMGETEGIPTAPRPNLTDGYER